MQYWPQKAPGDIVRYVWKPPFRDGDGLSSFSSSVSGAVIDAEEADGDEIVFYVSGGAAGATAIFTLVANTNEAETLTETIYLPIVASSSAFADTAEDIITFALKPVVGLGETASSDEIADALEMLNGMLAQWKGEGADVGATLPLLTSTVIYAPDSWLWAIKNNLRVVVAEQYGRMVSPVTGRLAAIGLQQIKMGNLPDERVGADYF